MNDFFGRLAAQATATAPHDAQPDLQPRPASRHEPAETGDGVLDGWRGETTDTALEAHPALELAVPAAAQVDRRPEPAAAGPSFPAPQVHDPTRQVPPTSVEATEAALTAGAGSGHDAAPQSSAPRARVERPVMPSSTPLVSSSLGQTPASRVPDHPESGTGSGDGDDAGHAQALDGGSKPSPPSATLARAASPALPDVAPEGGSEPSSGTSRPADATYPRAAGTETTEPPLIPSSLQVALPAAWSPPGPSLAEEAPASDLASAGPTLPPEGRWSLTELAPEREASGPPVVRVTIGRVEVRAPRPDPVPAPVAREPDPPDGRLSLDDYLARRSQSWR